MYQTWQWPTVAANTGDTAVLTTANTATVSAASAVTWPVQAYGQYAMANMQQWAWAQGQYPYAAGVSVAGTPAAAFVTPENYQVAAQNTAATTVTTTTTVTSTTASETAKTQTTVASDTKKSVKPKDEELVVKDNTELEKLNQLRAQAQQWTSQQQTAATWPYQTAASAATPNMAAVASPWPQGAWNQATWPQGQWNQQWTQNWAQQQQPSQQVDMTAGTTPTAKPADSTQKSETADPSKEGETFADLDKEEQDFDRQFKDWEQQFEAWKKQNENHPDKEAFAGYEKQWQEWRDDLLRKKELMRQERAKRIEAAKVAVSNTGTIISQSTVQKPPVLHTPSFTTAVTSQPDLKFGPGSMNDQTASSVANQAPFFQGQMPSQPYPYVQPYGAPSGMSVPPPVSQQQQQLLPPPPPHQLQQQQHNQPPPQQHPNHQQPPQQQNLNRPPPPPPPQQQQHQNQPPQQQQHPNQPPQHLNQPPPQQQQQHLNQPPPQQQQHLNQPPPQHPNQPPPQQPFQNPRRPGLMDTPMSEPNPQMMRNHGPGGLLPMPPPSEFRPRDQGMGNEPPMDFMPGGKGRPGPDPFGNHDPFAAEEEDWHFRQNREMEFPRGRGRGRGVGRGRGGPRWPEMGEGGRGRGLREDLPGRRFDRFSEEPRISGSEPGEFHPESGLPSTKFPPDPVEEEFQEQPPPFQDDRRFPHPRDFQRDSFPPFEEEAFPPDMDPRNMDQFNRHDERERFRPPRDHFGPPPFEGDFPGRPMFPDDRFGFDEGPFGIPEEEFPNRPFPPRPRRFMPPDEMMMDPLDMPLRHGPDMPPRCGPDMPPRCGPDMPPRCGPDMPLRHGPDMPLRHGPDMPPRHGPDMPPRHGPDMPPRHGPNMPPRHGPDMPPRLGPDFPPEECFGYDFPEEFYPPRYPPDIGPGLDPFDDPGFGPEGLPPPSQQMFRGSRFMDTLRSNVIDYTHQAAASVVGNEFSMKYDAFDQEFGSDLLNYRDNYYMGQIPPLPSPIIFSQVDVEAFEYEHGSKPVVTSTVKGKGVSKDSKPPFSNKAVFDYAHRREQRSPLRERNFRDYENEAKSDRPRDSIRDRDRDRNSERDRDRDRGRERDRNRDRNREFERDKERESDKDHRDKNDRERDRYREKERDRDKERDSKRSRDWDRGRDSTKDKEEPDRVKRTRWEREKSSPDVKNSDASRKHNSERNRDAAETSADNSVTSSQKDVSLKEVTEIASIKELLYPPTRFARPKQLVIILRGLPGSGKTNVAKLIKDKEIEHGGCAPRILSLDDYFMVETEVTDTDPETGKKIKKKEFQFEYEECMEEAYRASLYKSFKKTIDDRFFPFIIVDAINEESKQYEQFWSYAKQRGFQVYIAEMDCTDPIICHKRNIHKRSLEDINKILKKWEKKPRHFMSIDIRPLLQDVAITEVEMEDTSEPNEKKEEKKVDEKKKEKKEEEEEEEEEDEKEKNSMPFHVPSRWEKLEATDAKLDQLDGLRLSKKKQSTMEDYLQLPDDYDNRPCEPGKKRVRWADLEERKEQERLRAIGFVVGQTDWSKLTDPSHADRALTRTKYF